MERFTDGHCHAPRRRAPSNDVPVVPHLFGKLQFVLADALAAQSRKDDADACRMKGAS
jgi:hypothetical protein